MSCLDKFMCKQIDVRCVFETDKKFISNLLIHLRKRSISSACDVILVISKIFSLGRDETELDLTEFDFSKITEVLLIKM